MGSIFEERFGVTPASYRGALDELSLAHAEEADLFFEYKVHESLTLENGIVRASARNTTQGAGVRCVQELETGYAFTESFDSRDLKGSARAAGAVARQRTGAGPIRPAAPASARRDLYAPLPPAAFGSIEERLQLLREVDAVARERDPRIVQVIAVLDCETKWVQIVDLSGRVVTDLQPLIRLMVTCIAQEEGKRETGSDAGGGREGISYLVEGRKHLLHAREAARLALANLSADPAPAGLMTVVLGPGSPGILLHEAIGHGLEADFNRRGTSAFSNRIGQQVASPLCTVVDDGTVPKARGSLHSDDEGTPTGRTVLIENGILRGYLQDRLNARLLGMPLTGNARRESFRFAPMPRMTCTYMLSGKDDPADVVRSVDRGIYFARFRSGQVDITNGNFVFTSGEAQLIEGGKLTRPVKDATLVGNGPEILKQVSAVGNDLSLDAGSGTCGKWGQGVPVNTGLPTVKIDRITVGGAR